MTTLDFKNKTIKFLQFFKSHKGSLTKYIMHLTWTYNSMDKSARASYEYWKQA